MLIDITYFKGQIEVAQTSSDAVKASLQALINKLEPQFLEKLFGYELYKSYLADATTQRFLDIINGKEYTGVDGRLTKWHGLRHDKISPIANYVYFFWMNGKQSFTTGKGEKELQAQNASNANVAHKQADAWNEMVHTVREFHKFMMQFKDTYPEYLYRWNELYSTTNAYGI